jgi:protein gp37
MGDLFHDKVPVEYIAVVWAVMSMAKQHTFMVLTKRPLRTLKILTSKDFPSLVISAHSCIPDDASMLFGCLANGRTPRKDYLPRPNVWIGTSAENQDRLDERLKVLKNIPAAIRFVSLEPLLSPINRFSFDPDWVIVGAETGPKKRPMDPVWARTIWGMCNYATPKIPFFFKKDSDGNHELLIRNEDNPGSIWEEYPKCQSLTI